MSVLRDIFRRRWRSLLTISGIAIGVFALTVLGAVAEKANLSVRYIGDFYEDRVTVVDTKDAGVFGMGGGNVPIASDALARIRSLPGVAGVDEGVTLILDEDAVPMGLPAMIMGGAGLGPDQEASVDVHPSRGRMLEEGDMSLAVIGIDLVKQLDAKVGESVELRGRKFEVVGVLERTFVQVIDQSAIVPIRDAQELFVESMPAAFQSKIKPEDIVLQASVRAEEGTDADKLAGVIGREVDGVLSTGPTKLRASVEQLIVLLNLIVAAVGAVALLVGALSVVNAMLVAVVERTYEIGVKRAMGATSWRIARDVLFEAAVKGGLGGVAGLGVAALLVLGLNSATTVASGTAYLYVTGRLALTAVLFAVVLGVLGGAYPARYASRLDPVDALAKE